MTGHATNQQLSGIMSVRTLAQDAVNLYQEDIDIYSPHGQNVRLFLRGPVIALTVCIVRNQGKSSHMSGVEHGKTPNGEIAEGQHSQTTSTVVVVGPTPCKADWLQSMCGCWRKHLEVPTTGSNGAKDSSNAIPSAYDTLSRRTKARLEAFLQSVALALPTESPHQQDRDNNHQFVAKQPEIDIVSSALAEKISSLVSPKLLLSSGARLRSMSNAKPVECPQVSTSELTTRLELYLRSLLRAKSLEQDCVVEEEPMRAVKARVDFLVNDFVETVGSVREQTPILTRLLVAMTQELLAMDVLSEALVRMIRRLISDYEHATSFASLAFLSSPYTAAEQILKPMVLRYLRYLRSNWKCCEVECDLERMLSLSLDPAMRRTFKTIEFRSIGHLLEVCNVFRAQLHHIELASSCSAICTCLSSNSTPLDQDQAIRQALRDLKREIITINGQVLPPVTNRGDLIKLLSQTLNSSALTPTPTDDSWSMSSAGSRKKSLRTGDRSRKIKTSLSLNGSAPTLSLVDSTDTGTSDEYVPTSNDEQQQQPHQRCGGDMKAGSSRHSNRRQASFRLSTVDYLTKRLLLAACRTGTGGDAFFVVRDLFGGDDVEVVPSPPPSGPSRVGSIEIVVRLASVTIRCHGSFDVYPRSMVGDCEPLIQVHTTTSETISLQQVRAPDSSPLSPNGVVESFLPSRSSDDSDVDSSPAMIVQERKTDHTGRRFLSVRPALYEKVEVWNTPS